MGGRTQKELLRKRRRRRKEKGEGTAKGVPFYMHGTIAMLAAAAVAAAIIAIAIAIAIAKESLRKTHTERVRFRPGALASLLNSQPNQSNQPVGPSFPASSSSACRIYIYIHFDGPPAKCSNMNRAGYPA